MKTFYLAIAGLLLPGWLWAGRPLTEATFTQVINDVKVMAEASKTPAPAKVQDLFKTPDLLRTGPNSLAELMASDQTITRVGANTVFSFEADGRNINLEKGSVLFHSPKGKGGGTIKTRSASAAVLGTTIIVVATANGGFKAILLEGRGQIRLPNGNYRILQAGQLVFILPGATQFGPVLNVNLGQLVKASRLVNGFQAELPSLGKVTEAIRLQELLIEKGEAEDTHLLVGGNATKTEVEVIEPGVQEQETGNTLAEGESEMNQSSALVLYPEVQQASSRDAIISTSILNPTNVFLTAFPVSVGPAVLVNSGFVANNISIVTPSIDLTQYTTAGDSFDITAFGQLSIATNLTLFGLITNSTPPFETSLVGVNGVTIAPGSTVGASCVGDFAIVSGASVNFSGVHFYNYSADRKLEIELTADATGAAFGDATFTSVDFHATQVELSADNITMFGPNNSIVLANGITTFPGALLHANKNLLVGDLHIGGPMEFQAIFEAGQSLVLSNVTMSGVTDLSASGSTASLTMVGVYSGEFSISTVNVLAAGDLTLANSTFSNSGSGTVALTAGGNLTILNSTISSFAAIHAMGQNISIQDGTFGAGIGNFDATDTLAADGFTFFGQNNGSLTLQAANKLSVTNLTATFPGPGFFTNTAPTIFLLTNTVIMADVQVKGEDIYAGYVHYSPGPGQSVNMVAVNDLTLENDTFSNNGTGAVTLSAGGNLTVLNSTASLFDTFRATGENINIQGGFVGARSASFNATGNLTIGSLSFETPDSPTTADLTFLAGDKLSVTNFSANFFSNTAFVTNSAPTVSLLSNSVANANVLVTGQSVSANYVQYSPGQGQTVKMVSVNDLNVNNLQVFGSTGSALNMQAGNMLNAANWQLSGLASINLQANTVNLQYMDFPTASTVYLGCQSGYLAANANTGQLPVAGHVNFINGVSYGGTLISSSLGTFTGNIPGTGITVGPRN